MKRNAIIFFILLTGCLCFTACSKTRLDDYAANMNTFRSYLPLQIGDVHLYRLDSTVTAPFGTALVIHSYLLKDSIGSVSVENTTDTVYAVYRYLNNDTLQMQPWQFAFRYRIVVKKNTVERIDENNRRFIILVNPVKEGYNWDGNRYFVADTDNDASDIYYGWNYHYENINTSSGEYSNTITINQVNNITGNTGDFDPDLYQAKTISKEIYAKEKGLVYKEFLYTIYQPNGNTSGAFGNYDDHSFGIKMTLLQ